MNAKQMLDLLRDNVNEATASHYSDVLLVRRLNQSQRKVAMMVTGSSGQWLITSTSVTPSSSVITLPSDCGKPIYLEETSTGAVIEWLGSVTHRRVSRAIGTSLTPPGYREAYPLLDTIEVNQESYATACTLWYEIRVPDLHTGDAAAAASTSLTFAADANRAYVADYYNNVYVEQYDAASATAAYVTFKSLISDYTTAGVCTVTGTPTNGFAYGTIPRLPEEVHYLIVLEATVSALLKPSSSLDEKVLQYYMSDLKDTRKTVSDWLDTRIPGASRVAIGDPY